MGAPGEAQFTSRTGGRPGPGFTDREPPGPPVATSPSFPPPESPHIYFTGLLFMATNHYPTVESPTSNYENCQGDHQEETITLSPLREDDRRRVLPRARGRMRGPPRDEGAGRLRTGHTLPARRCRRRRRRPGPAVLSLSNWKAAPGFPVSRCHVSKWLFSVRPIRKLTHHAVTAANFFPLHVRWIAR